MTPVLFFGHEKKYKQIFYAKLKLFLGNIFVNNGAPMPKYLIKAVKKQGVLSKATIPCKYFPIE